MPNPTLSGNRKSHLDTWQVACLSPNVVSYARHNDPKNYLLAALMFIGVALFSLITGKAPSKGGRFWYRKEDPKDYWQGVIACVVLTLIFIGLFVFSR